MKLKKGQAILLFVISLYTFFLFPLAPLMAQTSNLSPNEDLFAPVIQHTLPDQPLNAGTRLKLKGVVVDNDVVNEVTLFYRISGEKEYTGIQMKRVGKESYSILIPKEALSTPEFEYYIQAIDKSGNTSLKGFSSSPLRLVIAPLPLKRKEEVKGTLFSGLSTKGTLGSAENRLKKHWYKKWWVWTIALAVVGGAALSGGDGGGSSAGNPTNGSATFSGPVP